MAVTVTHATVTAVPDDPAYDIGSDEWNAAHTVTNALDKTGDTMTGALAIGNGTLTASSPALDISQTWNNASVAFSALKLTVTGIGSGAINSTLAEFVRSDGYGVRVTYYGLGIALGTDAALNGNSTILTGFRSDAGLVLYGNNDAADDNNGRSAYCKKGVGFTFNSSWPVIFGDTTNCTGDVGLSRNAAGVLEVNSATAGTLRDLKARNVITPGVTVANLAGAAQGARSFVTDATQTLTAGIGAVVTGGGANAVPVHYDGTNWRIG